MRATQRFNSPTIGVWERGDTLFERWSICERQMITAFSQPSVQQCFYVHRNEVHSVQPKRCNMLRRSFLAGLAGVAMAAVTTIPAHADQWVMLGQQSVGLNPDKDVFYVGTDEGRYEALRFRVFGNQVAFAEARVLYGKGTSEVL